MGAWTAPWGRGLPRGGVAGPVGPWPAPLGVAGSVGAWPAPLGRDRTRGGVAGPVGA